MAAKRKTAAKTRVVYRTAPAAKKRRRTNTGVKQIPAAGLTVGLVAANRWAIGRLIDSPTLGQLKTEAKRAISPEKLKQDVVYGVAGMLAGEAIRRVAPAFIKTPMGKLAKKIPKVI